MRKIYTRTGDEGMTGIHGGERVPKDDIRIEANGCLDELNTLFGVIRSMLPETARFEMQRQQWQEEKWLKFSYKRKKKDSDQ
ncbi:ATP:cob(I)alamin adenosyltransferase [Bacteroides caecigallinarum]|nr:ATP:cob(I)alamin adenosyltransferase [Bacteroides caecigallinarum]MDN0070587.1 ATP:cob(I)alamin adenosyltransferase [Bacteroides caecigallinarum]